MWYKNKSTRTQHVMSQSVSIPTDEFIHEIFERYIAVKIPNDKLHNEVTCSKCQRTTVIPKSADRYTCRCGYLHTKFKTARFKNMHGRYVVKSVTPGKWNVNNYWLVYYQYYSDTVSFEFTHKLIAKSVNIPEKHGYPYLYNIAFARPSKYDAPVYSRRNTVAESRATMDYSCTYNTPYQLSKLFYIDVNDPFILGYDLNTLIRNNYLIEILQKYKSSYLFHELKDHTQSTKLLDIFDMRACGLSNKQVVGIIKYYAKTQSLDVSVYKDYINDLRFLSLTMNRSNLHNRRYNARHQNLSNRIADMKQANKDLYIKRAYRRYSNYEKDGVFITYPVRQRDLNNESVCLNHCVRRYADDIIDNKLKIFFVRVEPGTPFITAEVKRDSITGHNKITQFRGLNNLTSHIDPKLLSRCRIVLEEYIK